MNANKEAIKQDKVQANQHSRFAYKLKEWYRIRQYKKAGSRLRIMVLSQLTKLNTFIATMEIHSLKIKDIPVEKLDRGVSKKLKKLNKRLNIFFNRYSDLCENSLPPQHKHLVGKVKHWAVEGNINYIEDLKKATSVMNDLFQNNPDFETAFGSKRDSIIVSGVLLLLMCVTFVALSRSPFLGAISGIIAMIYFNLYYGGR